MTEHFVGVFALAPRIDEFGGGIPDRDEGHGRPLSGAVEELAYGFDVEIADPASAESAFGGRETKVLDGDGQVDVAMRMLVGGAHPLRAFVFQTDVDGWGGGHPGAGIGLMEGREEVGRSDIDKSPRLAVAGRWGEEGALFDIVDVGRLGELMGIGAHRSAAGNEGEQHGKES